MESRPENTKRRRRHHAPTRRGGRRGEILKKCEEILENLRSQVADLREEARAEKKNEDESEKDLRRSTDGLERVNARHGESGDHSGDRNGVGKKRVESDPATQWRPVIVRRRDGAGEMVRDDEDWGRPPEETTPAESSPEAWSENNAATVDGGWLTHDGGKPPLFLTTMFSDREGTKKAWPESTLGEDERSGGDENAAETVEEEWLARDEGEQLLSRSVKACDAFGKESKAGVEWSSMQLDLINSLGQAQHLILAPTNPDFFNIEKRLIKVISEKKHKLVGFGWARKKVDLTFNPMGQAHRFIIITPTIFTNSGGVLQVEKEINQKKLMGFDGAQNSDLSMNFKVVEKAFGTVGAPKIELENMKILFPTNTNILKRCKVKEGDVRVLIIMESPFVHEWDPGGCIRGGWNPSGIKGDENLQESATTSAMKCHEIQTHQYYEEEIATYIENMLRLESGAIGEIVWGTRLPVIVDRLIELDVQIVWEGNLQEDADGIVERELEEVLNFLHLEFCQSSGWLVVAYLASYLSRAKFLSAALVANIIQRRSLMDVPRLEFQLLNKPMEPIWKHKSSPLKVCLPTAVEELLRRAKAAQRFMASENVQAVSCAARLGWCNMPIDEHLIQRTGYSTISVEETHHKKWDLGENFSDYCIIETSCFKLWDPGGLCLLFTNHLEDKVNFKGGGIDRDLVVEGQNRKFVNVYEKGKWRKMKKGATAAAESSNTHTQESN